jgi:membrane-bound lytic murein transglycosylase A
VGPLGRHDARRFLEANFRAQPSPPSGVLTAYFAPIYEARRRPDAEFSAPVRPRPPQLGDPAPARTEIEASPADGASAWMRPEDLFFLQIQGSGVLTFDDGPRMKALYVANNGRPFVPIANAMRDRGLLARDNTSGEAIRAWLRDHRGPQADEVMRLNPRYVFFRLAPDDGRQPVGAAGVPLPAGRAIAVDLGFHQAGEVFWLDAEAPLLKGAFPTYRRLVMALDTGGAIKGDVRADLYLGLGPESGAEAGRVRHSLKMFKLVPRAP